MDRHVASVAGWPVFIVLFRFRFTERCRPLQSGSGCGMDTILLCSVFIDGNIWELLLFVASQRRKENWFSNTIKTTKRQKQKSVAVRLVLEDVCVSLL